MITAWWQALFLSLDSTTQWLVLILTLSIGTFLLVRFGKVERHGIILLVKIRVFLSLLEKIAHLSPRFWKFFADLAIVFSFSGLGAGYLSSYRKKNRHLDIMLLMLGTVVILPLISSNVVLFSALLVALLLLAYALHQIKNRLADFLVFSALGYLFWLQLLALVIQGGLLGSFSQPLIINLIALVVGMIGVPGLVILSFLYQGYLIIFQSLNVPGVSPFLPASQDGEIGLAAPGTGLFIPLGYFLIAVVLTLIPHEFAHGILTKVHDLKLKSTGIVILGIIPVGAFVEPDEKEMKKKSSLTRMRIFSVGSFANFIVALGAFLLMVSSPLLSPYLSDGITVIDTQEGYPAFDSLSQGMVIYEINSQLTRNVNEFMMTMSEIEPGEEIWLRTEKGLINITTTSHPERPQDAYLGIHLMPHLPGFINQLLFWIFFINFSIALVNLLPLLPLDGGRMLQELVGSFKLQKKIRNKITYGVIAFILLLVIINIWPLLKMSVDFVINLF